MVGASLTVEPGESALHVGRRKAQSHLGQCRQTVSQGLHKLRFHAKLPGEISKGRSLQRLLRRLEALRANPMLRGRRSRAFDGRDRNAIVHQQLGVAGDLFSREHYGRVSRAWKSIDCDNTHIGN